MTSPRPDDELLRRYHEASAQDTRSPGAQVRGAVRAHAQAVLAGQAASGNTRPAPAANQPRWKLSLLASVAVLGLAGLLVLQFERGTPEEKELVAGQSAAGRSPVTAEAPTAPATPAAGPDATAARDTQANTSAATIPTVKSQPQPTRALPPAPVAASPPAIQVTPAPPPPITPVAPVDPAESAAPRSRLADASAPSAADEPAVSARSAAAPAATLRAVPAVTPASPRAAAQQQKLKERTDETGELEFSRAAAASLHASAGAGRLAQVEQLISRGAAINAPDAVGKTPLMLAAINGHSAVVQRLLAAGANPALVDRDGLNAAQHARRLGREAMAQLIEAGQ